MGILKGKLVGTESECFSKIHPKFLAGDGRPDQDERREINLRLGVRVLLGGF